MNDKVDNVQARKKDRVENSLRYCFRAIVEGKKLELDLDELNIILKSTFQIQHQYLNPQLKMILPYMLVHFMKSWPGWQKCNYYMKKQLTLETWFNKFREYLLYKINYMIKNEFEKALQIIKGSEVDPTFYFKIDNSTQTATGPSDKIFSPFTLEIKGPPRSLNSMIFCEGPNDSILLKEYCVNTKWSEKLKPRQLINWPFIDVEYKSSELHFKRSNIHEFQRNLTLSTEKLSFKKIPFIEEVDIINNNELRQAYTINSLKEYCNSLLTTLNEHKADLIWTKHYWSEVKTVLEDFILDLEDIGINESIATNTSVVFNIGKSIYARNKCIKTSNQSVSLAETLIPKIHLSLFTFDAIENINESATFKHVDVNGDVNKFAPNITYACTYCEHSYSSYDNMWRHLRKKHIIEQHVVCFKCKLEYKIMNLTENRWGHCCQPSSSSGHNSDRR